MRSEAQKRADRVYRAKKLNDGTKKQINATLDINDYDMIDTYCNNNNISKAKLIINSIKYCINNNINILDNQNNNANNNNNQDNDSKNK